MKRKSVRHLLEAIEQGQLNKIICLIKQGHNIYVKNTLRQNLLVYILQQQQRQQDSILLKKRFQIFKYLLSNSNLDIHSFDSYGKNIFNWATNLNCTDETLYLLNSYPGDLDILVRDQSGSCSLHYAVEHGNDILVHAIGNYLLRYRLRFDIKDAYNNTPEDLARKLGYDKISHFLNQVCRSTVHLSREILFYQPPPPPPVNDKTKATTTSPAKPSEYFNLMETRINAAKSLDDWKTVAALRAFKRNINDKNSTRIPEINSEINIQTSSIPSLPKILPSNIASQSISQPAQMLQLFELRSSSSFRLSFIPVFQEYTATTMALPQLPTAPSKMSHTSSGHGSSSLGRRKRDSDASQTSNVATQDVHNHQSMPPIHKQHRLSVVTTH